MIWQAKQIITQKLGGSSRKSAEEETMESPLTRILGLFKGKTKKKTKPTASNNATSATNQSGESKAGIAPVYHHHSPLSHDAVSCAGLFQ